MSTPNPQSVLINRTVATLLSISTTTVTDIQNYSSTTTVSNPLYNGSNWNPYPYCLFCYPPSEPTALDSTDLTLIYYALLLIPLVIVVVAIKLRISRQKKAQIRVIAAQRVTARQQTESSYGSTQNNNGTNDNSCHMGPKEFDSPPAYDEVMQSYLMAKQQSTHGNDADANEGAVGFTAAISTSENNLSTTAISTLTIDTNIVDVSDLDLNNPSISSMMTAATTEAVINIPPPSYETSIEMSSTKVKIDHIV